MGSDTPHELDREDCLRLAEALPDTPGNAESIGPLTEGRARAWIKGSLPDFQAAMVQWHDLPAEPVGFGSDPEPLFELLQLVPGWTAVDVEGAVAPGLKALIETRLKRGAHLHEAVGFQLLRPVKVVRHPAVRELLPEDAALLDAAALEAFRREHFENPVPKTRRRLGDPWFQAGAIMDGRLVGFVGGSRCSTRFAVLGAGVLEAYRGRGLATAAASLVAGYFQTLGLIPAWSTGVGNPASMAVPTKLGFEEVLPRSSYVVLNPDAPT